MKTTFCAILILSLLVACTPAATPVVKPSPAPTATLTPVPATLPTQTPGATQAVLPVVTPAEWDKMLYEHRVIWLDENKAAMGVAAGEKAGLEYVYGMVRAEKEDGSVRWYDVTTGKWIDSDAFAERIAGAEGVAVTGEQLGGMKPMEVPQKFVYDGETYTFDWESRSWKAEGGQALAELVPVSFFEESPQAVLWKNEIRTDGGHLIEFYYSPYMGLQFDTTEIDGSEAAEIYQIIAKYSDGRVNPQVAEALAAGAPIKIMAPDNDELPGMVRSVFEFDGQKLVATVLNFKDGNHGSAIKAYVGRDGSVMFVTFRDKNTLSNTISYINNDPQIMGYRFSGTVNDGLGGKSYISDDLNSSLIDAGMKYFSE